jgi:hypothetical protein
LCSLVTVISDAYLIVVLDLTTVTDTVSLSLVTGLGFLVPSTFKIAINPLFPVPCSTGCATRPASL